MTGIKKLDLYVVKNFCTLFAGTFFVCLFVFMMQFLWRYVDDLIGKGLTLDVLAKFFYYSGLTLIPTSLPLAILLASLISFGNLGERLELLAIRAAGISLIKVMRPLIIIVALMGIISFYFQNVVGPDAATKLYTLVWSMKQTSPELEIPEGAFYGDIPGYNVYVKHKDKDTGMLYDVMIYSFAEGFENARVILADSGRLDMSANKQHLILNLYQGEQFENLQNMNQNAINIPYRRETFIHKQTIINFDGGFQMQDANFLATNSSTKSMEQINRDIDSMTVTLDSTCNMYYKDMRSSVLQIYPRENKELEEAEKRIQESRAAEYRGLPFDSIFQKESVDMQNAFLQDAHRRVNNASSDIMFKQLVVDENEKLIARHWIEWHRKITLSIACLVFFFIGAPLGAIIRKGGLGFPVIISVIIFIIYYIIDNTAYRSARNLTIPPAVGMWLSTVILAPVGAFLTYKSNNDSVVFNMDAYRNFFRKLLGLRTSRKINLKEVVIETPDYPVLNERLLALEGACKQYAETSKLMSPPNYLKVFLRSDPDHEVEKINEELESIIEELGNSKSIFVINELNQIPVLSVHAHTSPFGTRWKNALAGILLPIGIVLYIRIWRYRIRLLRDMKQIVKSGTAIRGRIADLRV
ncbi:MAG: LptF/LptG family permease [Bacteroidaceae bacterium]|nr:LptF/LptG family permease [Bacteroidaceae bacterium]